MKGKLKMEIPVEIETFRFRRGPMGFTFLVWNVEKFRATNATRVRTVARHILDQQPDVFCILEFRGKNAARRLISS